jgi:ABC-type glycerol-3-phosphate transport system permease component
MVIVTGLLLGLSGWLLLTSPKRQEEVAMLPVQWLPESFRWGNYSDAVLVRLV